GGSVSAPATPPSEPHDNSDGTPLSRQSSSIAAPAGTSQANSNGSAQQSEHTTEDDQPPSPPTPDPPYLEVEHLSRLPSYSTAVRTTLRTAFDSHPPDYDSATGGGASPILQSPSSSRLFANRPFDGPGPAHPLPLSHQSHRRS